VVCNGISDPCPGFDDDIPALRATQASELSNGSRPLRVLFLSRGSVEKGVIDALESLGIAARSGAKIQATFAGGLDADVEHLFIARMRELESAGLKIELTGFLNETEKARCFASHDLLLSTSRWESFGLTVVEAMAWGMPVVAAACDGVRGILPADYPYFSEVADVRDLGERVIRCGIDLQSGRGTELSTLLRRIYLENYTLERYEIAIRVALMTGYSK
jgi:glycosyltransferase involved in cell wall biosynthesis